MLSDAPPLQESEEKESCVPQLSGGVSGGGVEGLKTAHTCPEALTDVCGHTVQTPPGGVNTFNGGVCGECERVTREHTFKQAGSHLQS